MLLEPFGRSLGKGDVPLVGQARHGSERALAPLAPDHYRDAVLDRLGLAPGVGELEEPTLVGGGGVLEQGDDDLHALLEPIGAITELTERHAVCVGLHKVPTRPHTELERPSEM